MEPIDRYLAARTLPSEPVAMYQNWRSLLFLHFRCAVSEIAALLPPGLLVDTFDGSAWVGLVPFRMEGIRPVMLPAVPGLSAFPETNVRTYVHKNGVPGVWFFSLEASNAIACATARRFFGLPYHFSQMSVIESGNEVAYHHKRADGRAATEIECEWGDEVKLAEPGTLEFFLVERYVLFAMRRRRLCQGRVFHSPYPLRSATAFKVEESLVAAAGIQPREFEHVVFSSGVDVRVYRLTECCP